jgi:predicted acyl esterase
LVYDRTERWPLQFKELTLKEPIDFNKGRHVIHSGGKYDAHLTLPIIN